MITHQLRCFADGFGLSVVHYWSQGLEGKWAIKAQTTNFSVSKHSHEPEGNAFWIPDSPYWIKATATFELNFLKKMWVMFLSWVYYITITAFVSFQSTAFLTIILCYFIAWHYNVYKYIFYFYLFLIFIIAFKVLMFILLLLSFYFIILHFTTL